jgi:hypothetical protein
VHKIKVVVNIFIFNFAFHVISLKCFAEKIGVLSGLVCATPRTEGFIVTPPNKVITVVN